MKTKVTQKVSLSRATIFFQLFGLQYFSFSQKDFFLAIDKLLFHKIIFGVIVLVVGTEIAGVISVIKIEQKHKNSSKVSNGFIVQFATYFWMMVSIFVTAVHSYLTTGKAKRIFENLKNISKAFSYKFNYNINYSDALSKFNHRIAVACVTFGISSVATLGFIFYFNHSSIFYWALLAVLPNFIVLIGFWKFIFYIQLVNTNLAAMKTILENVLYSRSIFHAEEITFKFQPKALMSANVFHTILHLKQVYLTLHDTSELINGICGVGIISQLVTGLVGCISAGYKVYLISTGQLVLERIAGMKSIMFNY